MADTTTKGSATGDQMDAVNSIMGIANLFKQSGGGTTTQTQTSSSGDNTAAVNSLVQGILSGTHGLAATAQGQKSAGLYNSSSNKLLLQNLVTQAAGQGAQLNAANNKSVTSLTSAPTQKAALSPQSGLALLALSKLVNSESGKKLMGEVGNKASSAVDSISNWLSPAGDASQSVGVMASDAGAPIGGATGDFGSGLGSFDSWLGGSGAPEWNFAADNGGAAADAAGAGADALSGIGDVASEGSNYLDDLLSSGGYAKGGRVPIPNEAKPIAAASANSGVYSSAFSDPVRQAMNAFTYARGVPIAKPTPDGTIEGGDGPAGGYGIGFSTPSLGYAHAYSQVAADLIGLGLPGPLGLAFGFMGKDALAQAIEDDIMGTSVTATMGMPGVADIGTAAMNAGVTGVNGPMGLGAVAAQAATGFGTQAAETGPAGVSAADQAAMGAMDGFSSDDSTGGPGGPGDGPGGGSETGSDSGGGPGDGESKGGKVRGDNNFGVDDVKTKLDGGEYVIKAKSTQMIDRIFGPDFLDKLNGIGGM